MSSLKEKYKSILDKTIYSFPKEYYRKQLMVAFWCFFYLILAMLLASIAGGISFTKILGCIVISSINTLLYPYTALLTDHFINFFCYKIFPHLKDMFDDQLDAQMSAISGQHVATKRNNKLAIIITKFMLRCFAWALSLVIAPLVLIYCYIKNSRKAKI